MITNPTIDGVSLLPCPFCGGDAVLKQYRADGLEIRCTGCQSMRQQRWMYKGRDWLEPKMIEKWNERTTWAVECQEPVVLLSEHRKGLAAYLEQIKDQQSTIARLEARIAELESGKGEPVAYADPVAFENFKNHAHKGGHWDHEWMWAKPDSRMVALYTAPPAPVAVVLPERRDLSKKMFNEMSPNERDISFKDIGWNACLDATAALNEVKS